MPLIFELSSQLFSSSDIRGCNQHPNHGLCSGPILRYVRTPQPGWHLAGQRHVRRLRTVLLNLLRFHPDKRLIIKTNETNTEEWVREWGWCGGTEHAQDQEFLKRCVVRTHSEHHYTLRKIVGQQNHGITLLCGARWKTKCHQQNMAQFVWWSEQIALPVGLIF